MGLNFDLQKNRAGGKGLHLGVNMMSSAKHWRYIEAKARAAWNQIKRLGKLPWIARTVVVNLVSAILGYGAELHNTPPESEIGRAHV